MIVPWLLGGLTKVPPNGMCGGVSVAVLPTVAAGLPWILTSLLRLPVIIPVNGCGTSTGEVGPGGWIRCMSRAFAWSPCFAAGWLMLASYHEKELQPGPIG